MHLDDVIEDKAKSDGTFAIAYALLQISKSQDKLNMVLSDKLAFIGERLDEGLSGVASSISEAS